MCSSAPHADPLAEDKSYCLNMFEHNRCPLSYADRGANHKKAMLKNENNCVCVCMYLSSYISIHLYEMFTSGKFTETESMGWK